MVEDLLTWVDRLQRRDRLLQQPRTWVMDQDLSGSCESATGRVFEFRVIVHVAADGTFVVDQSGVGCKLYSVMGKLRISLLQGTSAHPFYIAAGDIMKTYLTSLVPLPVCAQQSFTIAFDFVRTRGVPSDLKVLEINVEEFHSNCKCKGKVQQWKMNSLEKGKTIQLYLGNNL